MSYDAVNWAIGLEVAHSSAKFVLVVMAHHANRDSWESWLSVAKLAQSTGQDRKTVMANLARLQKMGFISDTGRRMGDTKQVPVFLLNSPKAKSGSGESDPSNGTENGTVEEYQKRDSCEIETVPVFPSNSTVFPHKQYQFSPETVPKTGHGTSKNLKTINEYKDTPRFDPVKALEGMGVESEVARDWLALRKGKKLAPTQTAFSGVKSEADKAGISMNQALVTCCTRGWGGFKAEWMREQARGSPKSYHDERADVIAGLTGRSRNERYEKVIDDVFEPSAAERKRLAS